jgi:hypothetical protein
LTRVGFLISKEFLASLERADLASTERKEYPSPKAKGNWAFDLWSWLLLKTALFGEPSLRSSKATGMTALPLEIDGVAFHPLFKS